MKFFAIIIFFTLPIFISCNVSQEEPISIGDTSLLFRFSFEETGPPTVTDTSQYGNHGLVSGASAKLTYGITSLVKLGKCYSWHLNAAAPVAFIPINTSTAMHNLIKEMTITGWIYYNSISGTHTIISKYKELNGARSWRLYMNGTTLTFIIYNAFTTAGATTHLSTVAIPVSTWTFFALSYKYISNGTSQVRIYINNNIGVSSDAAAGSIYPTTTPVIIGAYLSATDVATAFFRGGTTAGYLDELRLYSRALPYEEIVNIYTEQKN